jgi:hypothetical protein
MQLFVKLAFLVLKVTILQDFKPARSRNRTYNLLQGGIRDTALSKKEIRL